MTQTCSLSNKYFSSFLAPYEQASKHLTFAYNGKVDHASQRIFASTSTGSNQPSLKERVLHVLTGIALGLPLVNFATLYFLSSLDMLIKEAPPAPTYPCWIADSEGPCSDRPARSGGVRFAPADRAREFRAGEPPAAVRALYSIERRPAKPA